MGITEYRGVRFGDGREDRSSIYVEDGRIIAKQDGSGPAADSMVEMDGIAIVPGFIDVHIHGAVGIDVNAADAGGLLQIAEFLARHGVTSWVPTLVPDSDENYVRVIAEIDRLMEIQTGRPVAQAVGVHYEGVFANEKMCGALRPQFFKKFTGGEVSEIPRLKSGVHMTTFAPEVEGGVELTAELTRQGWIASIGHTQADVRTLDAAFANGARHMTHFFNAMTGIHHRDIGVAGWGISNSGVTFDIIADGVHVDPRMLAMACRSKTPDKVTLISDSVAPTGLGDGDFEIWGEQVSVRDGKTQNERGSIAGSVITMHDAFVRMLALGSSIDQVSRMASANPARLLGLADRGRLEPGKRADMIGMRADGSLEFVMIGGEVVKS